MRGDTSSQRHRGIPASSDDCYRHRGEGEGGVSNKYYTTSYVVDEGEQCVLEEGGDDSGDVDSVTE